MKTISTPQFDRKWWMSARPAEIKGGDLEKALQRAEQALAAETKNGDPRSIDNCMKAVKGVAVAAVKSIKECDKKKHKEVIASLKKFGPLVKAEMKRLEDAKAKAVAESDGDSEDDEKSTELLLDSGYLEKCVRLLRKRPLNFALCMPSKVESAKFVFARKKSPKFLFTTLNKLSKKLKLGLPKNRMTFGVAAPDKEDKSLLVLTLDDEANQPMGLMKKGKKYLKQNKDLFRPFRKLKLVVNGKVVEDIPDPEDTEQDDTMAAAVEANEVQETATASSDAPQQETGAGATDATSEAPASAQDHRKQFRKSRKEWIQVRNQAIRDLETVKAGVLNYYLDDPQQFQMARTKLKELDEVMDNLNDDLRDALQDYAATSLKQEAKLREHGERAMQLLNGYLDYVDRSPLLAAIDQKEFADVAIGHPIQRALKKLAETIQAAIAD